MSQASLRGGTAGELQPAGAFDYSSRLVLCEQSGRLVRTSQTAELVVDCLAVECSSSVGISLLLTFMRDARKAGKVLSVRALPDDMREIAKVSSLLGILPSQERPAGGTGSPPSAYPFLGFAGGGFFCTMADRARRALD